MEGGAWPRPRGLCFEVMECVEVGGRGCIGKQEEDGKRRMFDEDDKRNGLNERTGGQAQVGNIYYLALYRWSYIAYCICSLHIFSI